MFCLDRSTSCLYTLPHVTENLLANTIRKRDLVACMIGWRLLCVIHQLHEQAVLAERGSNCGALCMGFLPFLIKEG